MLFCLTSLSQIFWTLFVLNFISLFVFWLARSSVPVLICSSLAVVRAIPVNPIKGQLIESVTCVSFLLSSLNNRKDVIKWSSQTVLVRDRIGPQSINYQCVLDVVKSLSISNPEIMKVLLICNDDTVCESTILDSYLVRAFRQ